MISLEWIFLEKSESHMARMIWVLYSYMKVSGNRVNFHNECLNSLDPAMPISQQIAVGLVTNEYYLPYLLSWNIKFLWNSEKCLEFI